MDSVAVAVFESWRLDIRLLLVLLATAWIYARGWKRLRAERPARYPAWRLIAFLGGLAALFAAIASPIDAFGGFLLEVHMLQHLLLLMIAPPLLWLGQPVLALLRGAPRSVLKDWIGPFLRWHALRRIGRAITHPVMSWLAMALAMIAWHVPALYELGLHSPAWHQVQHACFFSAALLFWWPVIQVWPSQSRWPRAAMIPYLIAADIVNTGLSAVLSFSDQALYPTYQLVPRLWGISALDDQATAGAIMWVPGSIAFLLPAVILGVQAFSPRRTPATTRTRARLSPTLEAKRPWDLLNVPVIGSILRYRYFRRIAQGVMFMLAIAIVVDGLLGPQVSPLNLAGVLPWTYWRGFAVIALLAAGNIFCMACPFTLPRDLGRRILPARRSWPVWLRSKWIAAGLLAAYLWSYEAFSLWNSPWWTAWIVIGYFTTAFIVDGLFQGASFCKYVCPIGQFHFVQSLVSPLEVKTREPEVCVSCRTHDCLHGNAHQRGCQLNLFQPTKFGNFDCTFCLHCVHACPQGNVGVLATIPGASLLQDRRLFQRADVVALTAILVFGAFVNAAGMTAPVIMWMSQWHAASMFYYAAGLVAGPTILIWLCSRIARSKALTGRCILALVPLGFSMWLAHFSFHLVTAWQTILPVLNRLLAIGTGEYSGASAWITSAQILSLDFGLIATLYLTWRIAGRVRVAAPWAVLAIALYASGIWIIFQPMQMRGMIMN